MGIISSNASVAVYFVLLLGLYSSNLAKDYYMGKWAVFCIGMTLFLANEIRKKTHWTFGLLMGYAMGSSLMVGLLKFGPYRYARNSILYEPSKAWIYLVCLSLVILFLDTRLIARAIKYLVPLNIAFTALCLASHQWHWGIIPDWFTGFDLNYSVNATLLAIMLPFCMSWWTALGTLGVIAWGGSTMGLYGAIAGIGIYYFCKSKNKVVYVILGVSTVIGLLYILYSGVYGVQLFSDSGRLAVWEMAYKLTIKESREIWGFGVGTFSHILPAAKILYMNAYNDRTVFLWAHNDYVQWAFEAGIVGCVIALMSVIHIGIKAYRSPMHFSFFAAYLVSCVGNFPSHLASSSLLCIVMVSLIYHREDFNEITF